MLLNKEVSKLWEYTTNKPGHVFGVDNRCLQEGLLEARVGKLSGTRRVRCMAGLPFEQRALGKCPTAYNDNSVLLQSSEQSDHGKSKTDSRACSLDGRCSSVASR